MSNMQVGARDTTGGILVRGKRIRIRSTAYFKHVFMSGAFTGPLARGSFMIKNVFGSYFNVLLAKYNIVIEEG